MSRGADEKSELKEIIRLASAEAMGHTVDRDIGAPGKPNLDDGFFELSWQRPERQSSALSIDWHKGASDLFVSVLNSSGEEIDDFKIWIEGAEIFAPDIKKFVRSRDLQDFVPIQLMTGTARLFHGAPELFRFTTYSAHTLVVSGTSEHGNEEMGVFRTVGVWRVEFRLEVSGWQTTRSLCFDWKHSNFTIPEGCECPIAN